MSNIELFSVISKQWASVNDIKILGSCGKDKAAKIRNQIIEDIKNQGYNLPDSKVKFVPMENVIEYFNINIDYIYEMAQKEKTLKLGV